MEQKYMAKLIGVVSKVIGQAFAISSDGVRRVLVEGDRLYAGEQLDTGAAGAVAVRMQNGAELTLGRGSSLTLSENLLAGQAPDIQAPDATVPSDQQLSDVERLQQAIAAGADPTQTGEATAAGPAVTGTGGDAGGGHSFVLLTPTGGAVDPTVGFPTEGLTGQILLPELFVNDVVDDLDADPDAPLLPPDEVDPGAPPPVDNEVTLNGLDVSAGEIDVNEANLPDGSASNGAALTQTGTFTVLAPDGLASLVVGGVTVISAGQPSGIGQSITTALGNTLVITGYNPQTGELTYSFTLTGNDQHAPGDGTNTLGESIVVVATDSDGDQSTGSLDINILDDVPLAVDDTNAATANDNNLVLTGTVLDNDVQGADRIPSGPITPATLTGTYGTLVLAADGTYTYTLNTSDADFVLLRGGGSGTESFTYTLNDADGDTSTATLTLDILNQNDPVIIGSLGVDGGEQIVSEANLSGGSAPNAALLTKTGTFTITANDGLDVLTIDGVRVIEGGALSVTSVVGQLGNTLTITGYDPQTGVLSYSYTLSGSETHNPGEGANQLSEDFRVTATDYDGDTDLAWLNIRIQDDTPTARDDGNSGTATENSLVLTGNVLDNDTQGADRIAAGPITPATLIGTYGTLVLAADGSYTYTLDKSDPQFIALHGGGVGSESFQYTLSDADGDTSTATLTLNILNENDPVIIRNLGIDGGELEFNESHLALGSEPNAAFLTDHSSFRIEAKDGLKTLIIDDTTIIENGVMVNNTVVGQLGNTLTILDYNPATGLVRYSYTLSEAEAHNQTDANTQLSEDFRVTAIDYNASGPGDSDFAWLNVRITDDTPQARNDANDEVASASNRVLSGDVLGNDTQGADRIAIGAGTGPITAGTFVGQYGTLVLAADGSYTYTLDPSSASFNALNGRQQGTERFEYTLNDADGDTSTATLTLDVQGGNDPVSITIDCSQMNVYEKFLADGSTPNAQGTLVNGTLKVTALDSLQTLTVGGIEVIKGGLLADFATADLSTSTAHGSLIVTGYDAASGTLFYTYQLKDNVIHDIGSGDGAGANIDAEQFEVVAVDRDGSRDSASFTVNIIDDVPVADSIERTVNAGTMDSNLVIVLDVSNSMNDPSRVGNLSRLDLAKQSIGLLLDQYADLGNVSVQLVAFNNKINAVTSEWVSVAQAKQDLAGLTAGGGTNYDYALQGARDAYDTTLGKISGGQNLTYFFSDGNPTLSSDYDRVDLSVGQSGIRTDEDRGDGILGREVTDWHSFLETNQIKAFAIGLGISANQYYLQPVGYDGVLKQSVAPQVVTELGQLDAVLADTVQGARLTGSLLDDSTLGADGGYIKAISLDGNYFVYDPATMSDHVLEVETPKGGQLTVDMQTGAYVYLPPALAAGTSLTDTVGFVLIDGDGDSAASELVITVQTDNAPIAVADDVVTNILSADIVVPSEVLLANDSGRGALQTSAATVDTGWTTRMADFGRGEAQTIDMTDTRLKELRLARGEFNALNGSLTALVVVSGLLGAVGTATATDTFSVQLNKGESLELDHNLAASQVGLEWRLVGGDGWHAIADGNGFTADDSGQYQVRVTNLADADGSAQGEAYNLTLGLTPDVPADAHATYALTDAQGESTNGALTISYQAGQTLHAIHPDDTLLGGSGDDILVGAEGDNYMDGGAGNDTASYATAKAGVVVDLSQTGYQNTQGAGLDKLVSIENLIGSDFNDTLTGNDQDNVLHGGLGDDILTGGGGSDTFVWGRGETGHDTVTDFQGGQDTLDLSQLLQGMGATGNTLDEFLSFKVTGSGSELTSTIEVGSLADGSAAQSIDLLHYDITSKYGISTGADGYVAGGQDTASLITQMVSDHSLKVDTV